MHFILAEVLWAQERWGMDEHGVASSEAMQQPSAAAIRARNVQGAAVLQLAIAADIDAHGSWPPFVHNVWMKLQ